MGARVGLRHTWGRWVTGDRASAGFIDRDARAHGELGAAAAGAHLSMPPLLAVVGGGLGCERARAVGFEAPWYT